MKQRIICLITVITMMCTLTVHTVSAEEYVPGGTADIPAAEAYETWMQFEEPDTHTPAIDVDGCLNYSLAKLSVRYNLPVTGTDLFTDSYTYYVTFSENILTEGMPKMQRVADTYSEYLSLEEPVYLSGDMAQRMEQAYSICSEYENSRQWSYILKMTTSTGSDHYVMADYADTEERRLYLLDSGSWYINYLGDDKTLEKGYYITTIYPYHIKAMPGDVDGDFRLTTKDAGLLLANMDKLSVTIGDANHDGIVDATDSVYIARAILSESGQTVRYAIQSDGTPLPVATATTQMKKPSAEDFFQPPVNGTSKYSRNK